VGPQAREDRPSALLAQRPARGGVEPAPPGRALDAVGFPDSEQYLGGLHRGTAHRLLEVAPRMRPTPHLDDGPGPVDDIEGRRRIRLQIATSGADPLPRSAARIQMRFVTRLPCCRLLAALRRTAGGTTEESLDLPRIGAEERPPGLGARPRTPAHLGRQTHIWDATVSNETTGKTLALFRCTQLVRTASAPR